MPANLEHLLRLTACVLLQIGLGPIGTRDRCADCGRVALSQLVGRERGPQGAQVPRS